MRKKHFLITPNLFTKNANIFRLGLNFAQSKNDFPLRKMTY